MTLSDAQMAHWVVEELHAHARLLCQVLVAWFTFFMTIQVGAIAWALAGRYGRGDSPRLPHAIYWVSLFYALQNCIGLYAVSRVSDTLEWLDTRLIAAMRVATSENSTTELDFLAGTLPPAYLESADAIWWTVFSNLLLLALICLYANRNPASSANGVANSVVPGQSRVPVSDREPPSASGSSPPMTGTAESDSVGTAGPSDSSGC